MNICVNRKYKKEGYTIGTLSIDGEYICDTLEPQDRGLNGDMSLSVLNHLKIKIRRLSRQGSMLSMCE